MRKLLVLPSVLIAISLLPLLGACELQPAPRQTASQAPPPAAAPVAPVAEPPQQPPSPARPEPAGSAAAAGSGSAAPMEVTEQCVQVGTHIANVLVTTATEVTERAALEQSRTRSTRAIAEACTKNQWSAAAAKCYLATQTRDAIKECEATFPARRENVPGGAPAAAPAAPAAGSAKAAPPSKADAPKKAVTPTAAPAKKAGSAASR